MFLSIESVKKFIEDVKSLMDAGKTEHEIAEALDIPKNLRGQPSVLWLRQFWNTARSYARNRINTDTLLVAEEHFDTIVQAFKDRTVARHLGGKNSILHQAASVAWFADYLNSHYND